MRPETISIHDFSRSDSAELSPRRWAEAGRETGRTHQKTSPRARTRLHPPDRRRRLQEFIARAAAIDSEQADAASVVDNFRLIFRAEKESRDFASRLHEFRVVVDASGGETARVCLLARAYLETGCYEFSESGLTAFLDGYQESAALEMREVWALQAAFQVELLDRLIKAEANEWPVLVASLRLIGEAGWKDLFESISYTDRVLTRDPAGAYSRMDFESRSRYRKVLADLAAHCNLTEPQIAEAAIDLCDDALANCDGSRAAARRTHVGYYLVDRGRSRLETVIGYRPPWPARLSRFLLSHPTGFYLSAIELLTLAIIFGLLYGLDSIAPAYAVLLLLLLPATQAASDFVNNLVTCFVQPRVLPKLDFSEGVPDDYVSLVAVPTLLLDETQIHDLVLDLEIRFLANRDRNLYFALLTDFPDTQSPDAQNTDLLGLCQSLIGGLNARYGADGREPFFLFHRGQAYNEAEGCWMGWERKRGKLIDLNRLLRGDDSAFPVKVGDLAVLPKVRYVITLDSDTQLPRDSAARLIGAIAHPLNQAVIDPAQRMVVEGYGILQPRMGISVQSAGRSRLASLYSGQTGFDIYTRAISDVYQDLFGEGIFAGKGIYEVDTLREVLQNRFPENALLSHDLIEGAYARAGLVSDIELIDDYPSHFSAYSRRKHRWVRGDWQIMRWIQSRVPDYYLRLIPNPIPLIAQWKILDNMRRSLLEPALMLLLLSSWLWLPGRPAYWTGATVLMWCIPVLSSVLFALLRVPLNRRAFGAWVGDTVRAVRENAVVTLCSLIFLLHQALVSSDAIIRSLARVFVTRKKMLEWETAAEAEDARRGRATVDIYLEWTPWMSLALAALIALIRPAALPAAAPLLGLWLTSRPFSNWLNRRPRGGHTELATEQAHLMREAADRMWRFFHEWSCASTNWLIPDSVRENGAVELKLSPTNLGMLLNARVAAVHSGSLPLAEFVFESRQTLDSVVRLPKYRGHLYNWYDIQSLQPLPPYFVSTVDSGNLVASLWTLKQAALKLASESAVKRGLTKDIAVELRSIAEICERLVREMDFRFLYQPRKKALSIGYDTAAATLAEASYDLLASEARMANFIAIAKGDIPQESWFQLNRPYALVHGERLLLSWTGTMFEYLMPALWMRHYPDTILDQAMKSAVRSQREYARRHGIPWGISECAYLSGSETEYGYQAFGVPELALQRGESQPSVVSPYSTFLAAGVEPLAAAENLEQMYKRGWFGRYGFYEAIDFSRTGGEAVRMWMAHHQGMSLLAVANLLFDNPFQRYFHAEPQVLATELLLHVRVPAGALSEVDVVAAQEVQPLAAA